MPPKLCLSGMQRGRKMLRQFLKLSADMSVGPPRRSKDQPLQRVTTSLSTLVEVECPYTKMATAANCGGLNPTVSGGPKKVVLIASLSFARGIKTHQN